MSSAIPETTVSTVAVTGATGFVGCSVVEGLHHRGTTVRGGVRSWSNAARLARLPVDLVDLDVLDSATLDEAFAGVDAVVHCAVGDERVTVEGTANVLAAAARAGVGRVVHLSSIGVYGRQPGHYPEDAPVGRDVNAYGQAKLDAEREVEVAADRFESVHVLRPTIIYGPFSTQWTINIAERVNAGRLGHLGEAGEGTANLVHVDDVVGAVLLAVDSDRRGHGVYNINGPDVITWNRYFEGLAEGLGLEANPEVGATGLSVRSAVLGPVRKQATRVMGRHKARVMSLYKSSDLAGAVLKRMERELRGTPTPDQLGLYGRTASFSIDRARAELGYDPAIDAATGIRTSTRWLIDAGLVDGWR